MIEQFTLRKAFMIMPVATVAINGSLLGICWAMGDAISLMTVGSVVVGNLLMLCIGIFFGGHYARRAETVVHALHALGEGDLTVKLKLEGRDDFSWLAYEYDTARRGVATLVRGIGETSQGMLNSVEQLSAGAGRIDSGSAAQSQAATQITAVVEETVASAATVADRTGEAHQVAEQARKLAASGSVMLGRVMAEIDKTAISVKASSTAITELGQRTEAINGMVRVIRDIAEQTNLLALNAAIEAARAGEQGRGFAVVADEVRKLAEKSARAALDITAEIDQVTRGTASAVEGMQACVAHVVTGVELAREADAVVSSLNEGAERTLQQVAVIALAMTEQRKAATAIAGQVEQIAMMAQQNRGDAEKNASLAKGLNGLSGELQGAIQSFRA